MIPKYGPLFEVMEIAPGVRRQANRGTLIYTASTQADLLRAGVAQPDWFRDGLELDRRGRVRRTRRFYLPDGRFVLTRVGARQCSLEIGHEPAQRAVYEEQWQEWLDSRSPPDDPRPRRVQNVVYVDFQR